jgi:hypothetical protein
VSILFQPHSQYMQLKLQYFFSVGSTFTPKLTPNLLDFIGPNTISSNNISNLILENWNVDVFFRIFFYIFY